MTQVDETHSFLPDIINKQLARYGVRFGIYGSYKDGKFREQLFPFDMIPRIISKSEFSYLGRSKFFHG